MAPRYAPFIHQFWTSPGVLSIVSQVAGVDLVPVVDYEICHTNVQIGPGGIDALKIRRLFHLSRLRLKDMQL